MNWTLDHIEKLLQAGKIQGYKVIGKQPEGVKKTKYRNTKTEVDGEKFDSKKEAQHWKMLRLRLKDGDIGMLSRQVEYELNPGGSHSLIYKADFVYTEMQTGNVVVEDVKGFRTREYKKKKRLMKKIYNIEIKEI